MVTSYLSSSLSRCPKQMKNRQKLFVWNIELTHYSGFIDRSKTTNRHWCTYENSSLVERFSIDIKERNMPISYQIRLEMWLEILCTLSIYEVIKNYVMTLKYLYPEPLTRKLKSEYEDNQNQHRWRDMDWEYAEYNSWKKNWGTKKNVDIQIYMRYENISESKENTSNLECRIA